MERQYRVHWRSYFLKLRDAIEETGLLYSIGAATALIDMYRQADTVAGGTCRDYWLVPV